MIPAPGFTNQFTSLKSGHPSKDKQLLLTAILTDGINLGLTKMADSCAGVTYAQLDRPQATYIRDETYSAALAELVNTQYGHPFAAQWGDGTTSSSDGQRFRAGSKAESTGHVNPKYGAEPGRLIHTHVSDQYSPCLFALMHTLATGSHHGPATSVTPASTHQPTIQDSRPWRR